MGWGGGRGGGGQAYVLDSLTTLPIIYLYIYIPCFCHYAVVT